MEQNRSKIPAIIGLIFSGAGIILATLLVCKHVFPGLCSSSLGCDINGVDGCSNLGKDPRSKLFGFIPFAIPGFFYYVFVFTQYLSVLRASEKKVRTGIIQVLLTTAAFGFILDAILAYINFVQLPVPCLLCAYSYVATLGIAITAFALYQMEGRVAGDESSKAMKDGIRSTLPGALVAAAVTVGLLVVLFAISPRKEGVAEIHGSDLLPESEVATTLRDFRALNSVDLNTTGLTSVEGEASAYIEIHKFADFRCPHCYHAGELLKEAMERWPGRIKIFYRHFPLDGTCNPMVGRVQEGGWSCNGAQAALCAPAQGILAPMYHGIFDFQVSNRMINLAELQKLTESLGGNWNQLFQCMGSRETARALERDLNDAKALEIKATPTLLVDGHMLTPGSPDRSYFLHLMDALVFEREGKAAYESYNRIHGAKE